MGTPSADGAGRDDHMPKTGRAFTEAGWAPNICICVIQFTSEANFQPYPAAKEVKVCRRARALGGAPKPYGGRERRVCGGRPNAGQSTQRIAASDLSASARH